MEYYDFFGYYKFVIWQDYSYRLIYVRSSRTKEKILVREYCDHKGQWKEQLRYRPTHDELAAIREMI